MRETLSFLIRRVFRLVLTVFIIATVVFVVLHVIPGDPAAYIGGTGAKAEDIQAIRVKLGIDRPIGAQFTGWIADLASGRLGDSMITGQPVVQMIAERFPLTLSLAGLAMLFAILTGIPFGILAAVKRWTFWDSAGTLVSQLGLAIPGFWLGILLLLAFAVAIPIFPLFGSGGIENLILPAIALGAGFGAMLMRHTRTALINELGKEYIVAARAKGLSSFQVAVVHALRNSLIPILTLTGIQFGTLLGGSVVIEQVFSLPGMGRLILTAVTQRDFPLVQGSVVFLALVFSLVNFLVDVLYLVANPRMRIS